MPTQVKYKVVQNYVDLEISGKGTAEHVVSESRKLWDQMDHICRQEKQHRVLARMQLRHPLPIRYSMDIARNAQKAGWSPNYKLAFVTPSEHQMTLQLVRSFMVHLGYEVGVFSSRRTARKWLQEQD